LLKKQEQEAIRSIQKLPNLDVPETTQHKADFQLTQSIARLNTSATLSTNLFVKFQRSQGRDITNFGLGESPFGAPTILKDALARNVHHTSYLPTEGTFELREEIDKFYQHYFGFPATTDRIIIGPGSKELILNSMLALDSPWLFVSPSWVSYVSQAKILGKKAWITHTHSQSGYKITEKGLRKRFMSIDDELEGKTLAILLNYPNNPTGRTLKKNEVQKIARFARNNELIILSDEIYANITHPSFGDKHHSMGLEYPEGTIVTGGVSKDRSLGGWRFGVAILPEDQPNLVKAFKSIGSETYSCVSAPLQNAMITAYNCNEEVHQHITDSTLIHQIVGKLVYKGLQKGGYKVPKPEGAFYLMPSLNQYRSELNDNGVFTSKELAQRLIIDYNIAVIPGTSFGLRLEDLAFRIAYIDYDGPMVLKNFQNDRDKALGDPETFIQENCPSVQRGIGQLTDFVDDLRQ
jgi:aspartate aminotransferase